MHVLADILGSALIAIGAWQIARRTGIALLGRPKPSEPGGWRNAWWNVGAIVAGVVWLTGLHGVILWVGLSIEIVILIVTFPLLDPFAQRGPRLRRTK
jgi:hypothetical protein